MYSRPFSMLRRVRADRRRRRESLTTIRAIAVLLPSLLWQPATAVQQDAGDGFDAAAFGAAVMEMREEAGAPGLAVAVLRDGRTLHAQGYGVAGPNGSPVTTGTAFQTGSITKSFVALVILQMASEGKLDLDDPVVRHVPGFRTADKSQSDRIAIDHLVTHRSGLTTLDGNRGGADSGLSGPAAAVAGLSGAQLFAEPGTTFQYSNANYALLSRLIEILDDRRFEQSLEARIFEPLGMTGSFVQVPPADAVAVATGYRLWFGVPRPWQPEPEAEPDRRMIGAGGVSASIEDPARYAEAVRTRDPRVVPEEADRLFDINPFHKQWGYSYGWYTNGAGEEPVFEHSGFTPGFFLPGYDRARRRLRGSSADQHVRPGAWRPAPGGNPCRTGMGCSAGGSASRRKDSDLVGRERTARAPDADLQDRTKAVASSSHAPLGARHQYRCSAGAGGRSSPKPQ